MGACMLMPLGASASAVVEVPPNPVAGDIFSDGDFIMDAFDAAAYGVEIRFPYMSDKVYKIYTQTGFVTDIVLEKNEKITYVGGGDTARWKVDTSAVGSPYESYCHLYVKPLASGITTDLIINAFAQNYRKEILRCVAIYNCLLQTKTPKCCVNTSVCEN